MTQYDANVITERESMDVVVKKKPVVWKAFLFLLMIPGQIFIDALLLLGGVYLDAAIYNPGPDTLGHAVPTFSALAIGLVIFLSLVVVVLALILTIISLVKRLEM